MPPVTLLVGDRLTMRGKNIDLNNFKRDVLSDVIEESRLNFEYTRDGKGELSNAK